MLKPRKIPLTAEMKQMMNFITNVPSQLFHVAVFTFDDALKDARRIRMEMWMLFKMFFFFNAHFLKGSVACLIDSFTNCPNCGWIKGTWGPDVRCYDLALFAAVKCRALQLHAAEKLHLSLPEVVQCVGLLICTHCAVAVSHYFRNEIIKMPLFYW